MESIKAFMAEVRGAASDLKDKVAEIMGKPIWTDSPTLDLEEVAEQIANITGESTSSVEPVISLKNTKAHVDQDISLSEAAHGITGFSITASDLGISGGGAASNKTVSRGNHVHKMPTAADVGAASAQHTHSNYILTSHPANNYIGPSPTATGTSGSSNYVARFDHSHSEYALTGHTHSNWGTTAQPLNSTAAAGTSTNASRADHQHPYPTPAQIGAAALAGSTSQDFFGKNLTANGFATAARGVGNGFRTGTCAFTADSNGNCLAMGNKFYSTNLTANAYADIYCNTVYYYGTVNLSDPSLKKNITRGWTNPIDVDIQTLAYNAVITFHYNHEDDTAPLHHGFDAEQIKELMPAALQVAKDFSIDGTSENVRDVLAIDPTAILAVLVQHVANQERRIEALEEQINNK